VFFCRIFLGGFTQKKPPVFWGYLPGFLKREHWQLVIFTWNATTLDILTGTTKFCEEMFQMTNSRQQQIIFCNTVFNVSI